MRIFAPMNSLITPQNFYEAIAGPVVYIDKSPVATIYKDPPSTTDIAAQACTL